MKRLLTTIAISLGCTLAAQAGFFTMGATTDFAELSATGQAQGDFLFFDGVTWSNLAKGADGTTLTSNGATGSPYWSAGSADSNANTICSGTTTYLDGEGGCDDISSVYQASDADLTSLAGLTYAVNGDLITTVNGSLAMLTKGTDNYVLTMNGNAINWEAAAAAASLWTDNGKNIYPADITDNVSIGHTFNSATLNLDGGISFKAQAEPTLDMSAGDYPRLYVDSTTNNLTFLKWDGMTQTDYDLVPGASVSGPGSSTDTAIALWDGTGGGTLKDSVLLVDAMGGITGADSIALGGSMANPLVVSTSALVVTTAGNVGIGTATPAQTFQVTRDMYTTGDTYFANNKFIKWADSGAMGNNSIIGVNSSDDIILQSFDSMMGGSGAIIFKSKPSLGETMRMDTNGFLGIGDTTPTAMLDVAGDIQAQESIIFDAENDDGTCTTTDTIDWSIGNHHKSTLGGTCTYTFTAPAGPTTITLKIVQDGTGSRTAVFPAAVKWSGGTAPTLSTAAASVDIVSFYYDGSVFYGASALDFQ
jgi:hypothetical protein